MAIPLLFAKEVGDNTVVETIVNSYARPPLQNQASAYAA
jgi:hypothetical protein